MGRPFKTYAEARQFWQNKAFADGVDARALHTCKACGEVAPPDPGHCGVCYKPGVHANCTGGAGRGEDDMDIE